MSKGLNTAVAATLVVGDIAAWLRAVVAHRSLFNVPRRHRGETTVRLPLPARTPGPAPAPPVTLADVPPVPRPRHISNLRRAFDSAAPETPAPAPVPPAVRNAAPVAIADWAVTDPIPPVLDGVTARDMHRRGYHTGMTVAFRSWEDVLRHAGISPEGPAEFLPGEEIAA